MIRVEDAFVGTELWKNRRLGIPTASNFDKIITPKTAKKSTQWEAYAHQLIAEQITGRYVNDFSSGYTERGNEMESEAIDYYELTRDVDTEQAVFILRNDLRAGCTPDRFVGEAGLLEIKCPKADVHVGYLLDVAGIGYRSQVQGELWIAERDWVDTLSYNPHMPPALVRQGRDESFIGTMASLVNQFSDYVDELKLQLINRGVFSKEDFDLKPRDLEVVKPKKHQLDEDMWQHRTPRDESVIPIDPFFKGPSEEAIRAGLDRNEKRAEEAGL